jgi:hypothetical protein
MEYEYSDIIAVKTGTEHAIETYSCSDNTPHNIFLIEHELTKQKQKKSLKISKK